MADRPMEKCPTWAWIIGGFVIIGIIFFFFSNYQIIKSDSAESSNLNNPVQATWHYVSGFSGPPDQPYYTFTIKGNKFRLTSTGHGYEGDFSLLSLYVFVPGSSPTLQLPSLENERIQHNPDKTISYTIEGQTFRLSPEEDSALQGKAGIMSQQVEDLQKARLKLRIKKEMNNQLEIDIILHNVPQLVSGENLSQGRENYSEFFTNVGLESKKDISYAGPGEYHLFVREYNIHNWNIQIEDYY